MQIKAMNPGAYPVFGSISINGRRENDYHANSINIAIHPDGKTDITLLDEKLGSHPKVQEVNAAMAHLMGLLAQVFGDKKGLDTTDASTQQFVDRKPGEDYGGSKMIGIQAAYKGVQPTLVKQFQPNQSFRINRVR